MNALPGRPLTRRRADQGQELVIRRNLELWRVKSAFMPVLSAMESGKSKH